MSEKVAIKAESRSKVGTRVSRRLRDEGRLPAVIYGHGENVECISMDHHDVEVAISHGARVFDIDCEGKTQQCLIKEVQYDYLGTNMVHLDLTRVDVNERIRVTVAIESRGTPKGVEHGGVMEQPLNELEVECTPADIPDTLHPVVTNLEIGQSILVKDLGLADGVTPIPSADSVVITVTTPTEKEDVEETEEGDGAAEPERIGRVRKDDEE
ncbi:MAG: 50S ribosomal protein L25 [Phycisphaerae bacterium]